MLADVLARVIGALSVCSNANLFFSELDCEQKRPGPVISPAATRSVSLLLVVVT